MNENHSPYKTEILKKDSAKTENRDIMGSALLFEAQRSESAVVVNVFTKVINGTFANGRWAPNCFILNCCNTTGVQIM